MRAFIVKTFVDEDSRAGVSADVHLSLVCGIPVHDRYVTFSAVLSSLQKACSNKRNGKILWLTTGRT